MSQRTPSVYPPIRGKAFTVDFKIVGEDGQDVLSPEGLAGRVLVDGRPFALRRAPALADAATGACRATIPPELMRGAAVLFTGTSTTPGSRAYSVLLYTTAQTLNQQAARERRRKIGGWK
jgi:hypothetical protein